MDYLRIGVRRRAGVHERLVLSINESIFMGLCIGENTVSRRVVGAKAGNNLFDADDLVP